jgi:hypothetical protein
MAKVKSSLIRSAVKVALRVAILVVVELIKEALAATLMLVFVVWHWREVLRSIAAQPWRVQLMLAVVALTSGVGYLVCNS